MKLTLWQQFSSNHSNSFMLVAQFETETDAQRAEIKIGEIMTRIGQWYEEAGLTGAWLNSIEPGDLSPIEEEIYREYRLPKLAPRIDWINSIWSPEQIVSRYKHFLVFESANTWTGRYPFDWLLGRLGGVVHHWQEQDSNWHYLWQIEFDCEDNARAVWWRRELRAANEWQLASREEIDKLSPPVIELPMYTYLHNDFEITVRDNHVTLVNVDIGDLFYVADALPAVENYLLDHGATNIKFSVYSI